MLTVAVLGPVEVHDDGELLTVPSGKTTEVLVRLALEPGRPVSADRIIEDLWSDAVGTGRNTLQSKVSQLRRALGDADLVTGGGGSYTLHVSAAQVDALAVSSLAERASSLLRAGGTAAAVDEAARGLELFRGEVLCGAGDGAWLQPHRARLEEVRLGLTEDHLAGQVALGSGADVTGDLESLVERYPLREGLWATLITALYRAGRQSDALAAYARVRAHLAEQLGVEPGPVLRDLELQVLRQNPSLGGGLRAPLGRPGNLPALTSVLVGRTEELASLSGLLREHRLLTVAGPAGVGKTRTAIELAGGLEPPGGVWLVRLDGVDSTASVPRVVAETLHVSGGEAMLADRFAGAESLLCLDNCEHVVDQVATLITRLLDRSPGLRVLTTSQVPLGMDGEIVYHLRPMPLSDSTTLFVRRAAAHRHLVLDEETTATVEEVCRSLDGLPLAIELAAARVRSLSVREIAHRLDDRFRLLRDPASRAPERRRALAAAIGWSYDLLFPDDQRGLWALACFVDGAPLAAAERVLEALDVPTAAAADVVDRLVDRSLVTVGEDEHGLVRYRLLDSVRAFARERLAEAGLEDRACAAHAAWVAHSARECAERARGPAQPDCVAVARTERANIDAALSWCASHDPLLGAHIATGFGWTWVVLGDGAVGAARVRAATAAAGALAAPRMRAEGLLLAGWLEASTGDVTLAQSDLDAAALLAEQEDDARLRADVSRHTAFLGIQQGRPHDVIASAHASLDTYRELHLTWETAASLLLAAYGCIMVGDTAAAARASREALELLTPLRDSWGIVHAHGMLGAIAQAEHRFDDAAIALAGAAAESERLGFLGQAALHLTRLGRVQQQRGTPDTAMETLSQATEAARRSGDLRIAATAHLTQARIHRSAGNDEAARTLLEETSRWYRAAGGDGALLTEVLLASVSHACEADASHRLGAVAKEAREAGDPEAELAALDALARLAAENGRLLEARRLLERADSVHSEIGHLVDTADRTDAHQARHLLAPTNANG